jgi:hypothetical protein
MRNLKISFTVDEAKAGSILADLSDRVSSVDYEVEEEVPFHRNVPRPAANGYKAPPSRASKSMDRTPIPDIFKAELAARKKAKKPLTVLAIKQVLQANKYKPSSHSYALIVLQKLGLIKKTNLKGEYEVI